MRNGSASADFARRKDVLDGICVAVADRQRRHLQGKSKNGWRNPEDGKLAPKVRLAILKECLSAADTPEKWPVKRCAGLIFAKIKSPPIRPSGPRAAARWDEGSIVHLLEFK